jgi:hypothetical protein
MPATLEQSYELYAFIGWPQGCLDILNIQVESSLTVHSITDGEQEKIACPVQKEASSTQEANGGSLRTPASFLLEPPMTTCAFLSVPSVWKKPGFASFLLAFILTRTCS